MQLYADGGYQLRIRRLEGDVYKRQVADLGEPPCWVFFVLVVVVSPATFGGWPGLVEMTPKHNALLEGVLDGPLMVGARLLEHLVEEVCTSGGLPRDVYKRQGERRPPAAR